jgi:hypothetical protein
MREHVCRFSAELGVQWSQRKWEKISALDRHIPLERGLTLAFGSLSKLFGLDFNLDSGSEDYRGLIGMLESRERFTHPKRPDDLCPGELFSTTSSSMEWVFHGWMSLLLACANSISLNLNVAPPLERRFQFRDTAKRKGAEPAGDPESRNLVDELGRMVLGLMTETKTAFNLVSKSFANEAEIGTSCAIRLLILTLISEIEGSVFIAASHLHDFREGYAPPSKELLTGDHAEVQGRIVSVLESFSKEFGTRASVQREGEEWDSFLIARKVRNRLTHPKSPEDVAVGMEDLQNIMKTISWWHGEVHHCLVLR